MIPLLRQILRTGIVTEPPPVADAQQAATTRRLAEEVRHQLGRALTIRHVDAGSCNGCELEIHALGNPYYNLEALGIKFTASPRHADLLLVTGPVAKNMEVALQRAYAATPEPRLVVVFGESYASCGRVANVIPVDVTVPGCPPTPLQLMQGILATIARTESGKGLDHHGEHSEHGDNRDESKPAGY
jgi:Ni,Fe-hydrogenase III small subunit